MTGIRLNPAVVEATREDFDAVHAAAGRPDFVNLSWAEHYRGAPPAVVEAYARAIRDGQLGYGPNSGDPELVTALVHKVRTENGIPATAENVLVTHGGGHALALAFQAVLGQGDEIVGFEPGFPLNWGLAGIHGARLVTVPVTSDPAQLAESLTAAVGPRTRAIVVHNPNNPTGHVLGVPALQTIGEIAMRRNLVVISDEVYEQYVYDGRRHHSIAAVDGLLDRTITIFGVSKEYGLGGLRVGYAVGGRTVISAMSTIQHNSTVGANRAAQRAVLTAIADPPAEMRSWIEEFGRTRLRAAAALAGSAALSCPVPDGGMFLMATLAGGLDSAAFAADLLASTGVAVSPGAWYGAAAASSFRVCYPAAPPEMVDDAMRRLLSFLAGR